MAAMALAPKGLGHYWKTHYADRTFQHLYRISGFDLWLLIPYFVVMVILAFYGLHRYQLVWLYFRNKKNASKGSEPAMRFAEGELPFVTIQLPIYNEQFVIGRLIDACCRLEYPRDRFEIQVLDDSTDETVRVAKNVWWSAMRQGISGWRRSPFTMCIGRIGMDIRRGRSTPDWRRRRGSLWRSSTRTLCLRKTGC